MYHVFDLITSVGERALRFALYFSVLYAFAAAASAAAGAPLGAGIGPAAQFAEMAASFSEFTVTNDVGALTVSFMRFAVAVIVFLLTLATAVYSAAQVVANILTAWGFGWAGDVLLLFAAVVQGLTVFYLALQFYRLVKFVISPTAVGA